MDLNLTKACRKVINQSQNTPSIPTHPITPHLPNPLRGMPYIFCSAMPRDDIARRQLKCEHVTARLQATMENCSPIVKMRAASRQTIREHIGSTARRLQANDNILNSFETSLYRMRLLESFSGTKVIGEIAELLGYEVASLDLKDADINTDILNWDYTAYKLKHLM